LVIQSLILNIMKKVGIILASILLLSSISFASPIQEKTDKKTDKKEVKKVPSKKKTDKKDTKTTTK
jgi:hypothetical protein